LLGAVMAIDCSVRPVTVSRMVLDVTLLSEALMLVAPAARAVAKPVALIGATAAFEEFQATWEVMLAVEPSL